MGVRGPGVGVIRTQRVLSSAMLPCPPKLSRGHPVQLLKTLWRQQGAPGLCEEGAWLVNIGAAWQGSSSVDASGKHVYVRGQDPCVGRRGLERGIRRRRHRQMMRSSCVRPARGA